MATFLEAVPKMMEGEEDFAERWLPIWESEAGQSFEKSSAETIEEIREQLKIAAEVAKKSQKKEQEAYAELTQSLGGLSPKTRGSGTITAVLSLWLAWRCEDRAVEGCRLAANLIGSDTDTIATMAGALAGPLQESPPPGPVCDAALHIREAVRAEAIGADQRGEDFPHPDPLRFKAPSTLTGFLGVLEGETVLAGLGPVNLQGEMMALKGRDQEGWQWARAEFGQYLLVKRRGSLPELGRWAAPRNRQPMSRKSEVRPYASKMVLGDNGAEGSRADAIEDAVRQLAEGEFEAALFDQLFRGLALGPNGAARAGVFGALVAERLRARELPHE